jgi:hypothetical protein
VKAKTVTKQRARPDARSGPMPGPNSAPGQQAADSSTAVPPNADQAEFADPESSVAELLADNIFKLPPYIRDVISARSSDLRRTKQFDKPYTDVLTCELPPHLQLLWPPMLLHEQRADDGHLLCSLSLMRRWLVAHALFFSRNRCSVWCMIALLPCRKRQEWTMNEHSSFVETWSAYILYDLPWKPEDSRIQDVFEGQWSRLRRGLLAIFRDSGCNHTDERIDKFKVLLEEYAESAEAVRTAWS